jgi:hypothetical protein
LSPTRVLAQLSIKAGRASQNNSPSLLNYFSTFGSVKKLFSLSFLTIYLFSTTQFCELLKMPILIEHYQEHKQENQALSLLGFLEMHYAHGNPKDADYDKDMKLPFKSCSPSSISTISFFTPFPEFKQQTALIYCECEQHQFFDYSFSYSSSFLSTIWQPPRAC